MLAKDTDVFEADYQITSLTKNIAATDDKSCRRAAYVGEEYFIHNRDLAGWDSTHPINSTDSPSCFARLVFVACGTAEFRVHHAPTIEFGNERSARAVERRMHAPHWKSDGKRWSTIGLFMILYEKQPLYALVPYCMNSFFVRQAMGLCSGIFLGMGVLTWYPDPIRVSHKGVIIPVAHDIAYVLRGLKMPVMWATLTLGTFSGVECLVEQMRDPKKESTYVNAMAGGAASGALMGSMTKRFDIMAVTALFMGLVEFNGPHYIVDRDHYSEINSIRLALTEEESDTLKALKEKYPEFKHY